MKTGLLLLVTCLAASGQVWSISTVAGGALPVNQPGTSAGLNDPSLIAVDKAGNVYFSEVKESVVLRLDAATRLLTLFAGNGTPGFSGDDGLAIRAQLNAPLGIALDSAGSLYISDSGNRCIRKVTNGVITTFAGGGSSFDDNIPATSAFLYSTEGIAVDSMDNLYIADLFGSSIRKVSGGIMTTALKGLRNPIRVAVDSAGGIFTLQYTGATPSIDRFFGGVDTPIQTPSKNPQDISVDSSGNLYIADTLNLRVLKVSGTAVTTVAGGGSGADSLSPLGVAVDTAGNIYIVDQGDTGAPFGARIRKVTNGMLSTIAGSGTAGGQLSQPTALAVDPSGTVYFSDRNSGTVFQLAADGTISPAATGLAGPIGIASDPAGSVYIVEQVLGKVVKLSNGVVTDFAGAGGFLGDLGDNGPALRALLRTPTYVVVDSSGNVYISDSGNNRIRKVSNGVITTVAGNGTAGFSGDGGPATSAQLSNPGAIAVDSAGALYITDNSRIRKVSNGVITTVFGDGTSRVISIGAVDSAGNLYLPNGDRILKVSAGGVTTIAGGGASTAGSGLATDAKFFAVMSLALSSSGAIYALDSGPSTGLPRIFRLNQGAQPSITPGGIAPVFSSNPVIQPGSWISIFGNQLAVGTALWNNDFPGSLAGTTVTINGKLAYLWTVSPIQINLQAPDDATSGSVGLAVTTPNGTATSTVTLAPQSPSFSLLGDGRHAVGEILKPGGYDLAGPLNTFSYATRPVKAGETLVLYGVGFGPTTPTVPAGKLFSGAASTNTPVTVTIGGVRANVTFAGMVEAGLYQINLTVPANTGSGDQLLEAVVNGVKTQPGVVVAVQ